MRYFLKKLCNSVLDAGFEDASTTHFAVIKKHAFKQKFRPKLQKNALFFGKKRKNRRSVGGSAPKPSLASPVTVTFSKPFVALTSCCQKGTNLDNYNNNVLLLHFISYFKLCAGYTLANTTGSDFSAS